jgi:hypothetical protein
MRYYRIIQVLVYSLYCIVPNANPPLVCFYDGYSGSCLLFVLSTSFCPGIGSPVLEDATFEGVWHFAADEMSSMLECFPYVRRT